VHSVVKHIHLAKWGPEHADAAAELLLELWRDVRECTSDPANPDTAESAQKAALDWLPWYLNWQQRQVTVAIEERWELTVPHTFLTLTGTIDRVYRAEGKSVLSDVKTGKRTPPAADLATDLQLSLYTWACNELGLSPDVIELVMMRMKSTVATTRSAEYLDAVIYDTVIPAAAGIAAGIFPANPSSKYGCGYCDYQSLCPVGRGSQGAN